MRKWGLSEYFTKRYLYMTCVIFKKLRQLMLGMKVLITNVVSESNDIRKENKYNNIVICLMWCEARLSEVRDFKEPQRNGRS